MEAFVLPPELEKFAGPQLPQPAKLMTAKGLAPLQPKDLITAAFAMTLDVDPVVAKAAAGTLTTFPEGIFKTALTGGLPVQVMDWLARHVKIDGVQEAIALHTKIHDETLCYLAEHGSSKVVDIISNNQTRIIQCPKILDALGANPLTGQSTIDRLLQFLQMEGVLFKASEQPEKEVSIEEFIATIPDYELPTDFDFPQDLADDMKEEIPEEDFKSLYAKVLTLSVMQKIKLAMKGNKEARSLLIRDPNKLVSTAVVKSPKLSEPEVIAITQSRTVSDGVLRIIANNKDWLRQYRVKLGLATNPKTPFDIGLSMLKNLRDNDIAVIAKSKSVPNAIAINAKRMVSAKADKKG